ncbi:MAG: hypothetical protein EBR17_11095 [Betaproteobacteria bacterium]|jgi:uncharacterized MAPEG superfamily protein|nr:MAPEG family protein [Burkholderiales bacterium]NBX15652.1 hypothetical protein [Betaproteobacteria bacterium]NBX89870.1 hypothetical protein [Betaproteobacteria bacterium]
MNISIASVLVAGLLPVVCAGIAKAGLKNYDNHNPREWLSHLTGYRARANAAQANSFEAFPFFAAAVLFANYAQVAQSRIDLYAGVFVLARVAYIACYLSDWASLRSLAWLVGLLCVLGLFSASLGA